MKLNGYKIIYVESRNYGATYGDEQVLNVLSYTKKGAVSTFNAVHGRWCKMVSITKNSQ
jgi:hypothetical protein